MRCCPLSSCGNDSVGAARSTREGEDRRCCSGSVGGEGSAQLPEGACLSDAGLGPLTPSKREGERRGLVGAVGVEWRVTDLVAYVSSRGSGLAIGAKMEEEMPAGGVVRPPSGRFVLRLLLLST